MKKSKTPKVKRLLGLFLIYNICVLSPIIFGHMSKTINEYVLYSFRAFYKIYKRMR